MQFDSIVGQTKAKSTLRHMIGTNRMPHALLFLGPPGCGKLAMAISFAQYALCLQPTDQDSCGTCANCRKVSRLIHPDLHFSFPTVGTNVTSDSLLGQWRELMGKNTYPHINQWLRLIGAENRQGNINKEECLNIIRKLSLKIFEGPYKVLIMWLPEYLGKEGNRLLKIIEEPPENTLFILVAENQELILNTILSRCQLVRFHPLSDAEVIEGLQQQRQINVEDAQAIAHLANGNLTEALEMGDNQDNDNAGMFLDWMRKCYKGNGPELVKWVEQFAKLGRENQKHFLRYALHFIREYMVLKLTGSDQVRLRDKELASATNLTKVIEPDQISRIIRLFDDCSFGIERNAHPKVLFLDASIKMNQILKRR